MVLYNLPTQERQSSFNVFTEEDYYNLYTKVKKKSKNGKVNLETVKQILGLKDPKYRDEYVDAVVKKAVQGMYDRGMLQKDGSPLQNLLKSTLSWIRLCS